MGGGSSKKSGGQQATDYRMAVHAGICTALGSDDAVTGIYIDGYTAWEGEVGLTTAGELTGTNYNLFSPEFFRDYIGSYSGRGSGFTASSAPGTSSISINQPNLFGGPTSGGGAVGTVEVMFGGPTQLAPPVLASHLGGTQASTPGFRGYLSLLFHDYSGGGFLWTTNNPVIAQNVDVRLRRTPVASGLDATIARIPDAQDVGFICGIGTSTAATAVHAANAINGSSQYFRATASGSVVTITERDNSNVWIDGVYPVADTAYPFRASTVSPTDSSHFVYYFSITSFGTPSDSSGTSGQAYGPAAGTATLTIESTPTTGMTFSIGPETYTFTSYAGDDANPAHIIYEVITNTDWGLGYPANLIDTASFTYAASLLFGESLGLSMIWAQQSPVEDFVNEVLNHISATLFISPLTGLFTLKLLRGDYDVSTLPVYTPDNAIMTTFERKMWAETINEIVVQWTNPVTEQIETVYAQNLANIAIQGGIVSDTRNYYGVRNAPLAAQLAAREIRAVSAPLCSMAMELPRSQWAEVPGGCVVVNWPENNLYGIVMRVGKVDYGSPDEPAIKVSLVEDIFGLSKPAVVSAPATLWTDPSTAPEDIPNTQILTLPYYFSASNNLTGSTSNLVYPAVQVAVLGHDPNRDASGFALYGQVALANGSTIWANLGTKMMSEHATTVAMVAEVTSTIACSRFVAADRAPVVGGFILIGTTDATQELCLVTASDGVNYTVNRGALDTVPQAWAAGTSMWSIKPSVNIVDTTQTYSVGETVTYKLLERTTQGMLPLASATAHSATLTARYYQPLRPANVKVNGVGFGSQAIGGATTLIVTWATRNRTLEQGTALAWTAGSVAPEYYQETVVSVYDQSNNLVYQQKGSLWTETSVTLQASWFARYTAITIVVSSQLNGNTMSLQGYGLKVTGLPGTAGAALPPSPPAAIPPVSPVTAPSSANWTVAGGSIAGTHGDSIPAITITGTEDSISDQALVIRYRQTGTSAWTVEPLVPLTPAGVSVLLSGLAAMTSYDVQLAYQESYGLSGNILSAWLTPSASPVTTGSSTASSASIASSVTGQGPLATSSLTASQVNNANVTTVTLTYSNGMTVQALQPAQANADKTSTNTAAAITGQGSLATQNTATTGQIVSSSGGTSQSDGSLITAQGTAGAVSGQGPWATYSGQSPSILASIAASNPNLIYDAGLTQGGGSWGLNGSTVASTVYGTVVTNTALNTAITLPASNAFVTPGTSYTFSFWTLTNNCPASVTFNWYGSSTTIIQADMVTVGASGTQQPTPFALTKIAPAGATACGIVITTKSTSVTGGTQFWRVKLERGTLQTAWNDSATYPGSITTGQIILTSQILSANAASVQSDTSLITIYGVASAIAGQGALATKNSVNYTDASLVDTTNMILNPSFTIAGSASTTGWVGVSSTSPCSSFSVAESVQDPSYGSGSTTVSPYTLPGNAANITVARGSTSYMKYATYFDVSTYEPFYVEAYVWIPTGQGCAPVLSLCGFAYDGSLGNELVVTPYINDGSATYAYQNSNQGAWYRLSGIFRVPLFAGNGTSQSQKMRVGVSLFYDTSAGTSNSPTAQAYVSKILMKRVAENTKTVYSQKYGVLTDAKIYTALGTASAITGQGALATLSTAPVANGGTGLTAAPANGQLLIGNGSGFTLATLTAGSNITIANSAGSITISASGSGGSVGSGTFTIDDGTASASGGFTFNDGGA